MKTLPEDLQKLLSTSKKVLNAVFEISDDGNATFQYGNKQFIDFHSNLGVRLTASEIIGMKLEDYFRVYLGFTDDQIDQRTKSMKEAVESGNPYSFKEVSEHPNMPVLILSSTWIPVKHDEKNFVIWESSVYTQTKLD
jgi:hypothetical protein